MSYEEILVPLLAARSCHLPGNGWIADWCQWFQNNHTLFGICLHHRLHPLESWERCLLLLASVSFGLVATNIVYQMDRYHVYEGGTELLVYENYTITHGMVLLWTLGGVGHSIFDMILWHIMSCPCCHPGGRWGHQRQSVRYKDCGSYALIPVIVTLLGFAIFLVLLRATEEEKRQATNIDDDDNMNNNNNNNAEGNNDYMDDALDIEIHEWESFSFLSQYGIEVFLTWFLHFPIVGTILFSGILGCNGRLPILGGRPRDLKRIEEGRFGFERF